MTSFLSWLLLSFLFFSALSTVHGKGEEYVEGSIGSLLLSNGCPSQKAPSPAGGSSLRVSHRYDPCSSHGGKSNQTKLLLGLLHRDKLRVSSLNDLLLNSTTTTSSSSSSSSSGDLGTLQASFPTRTGLAFNTGNYIITVSLGTPARAQTVVFDTGSTLTWVQCQPCAVSCYRQADPIFNPAASSTYRNLSCDSAQCSLLSVRGCTSSSPRTCLYGIRYGDNSRTSGHLSQDTLTLSSSDTFRKFVFGCGQDNRGLFGKVAGLVGLSRSPLSFSSQTSSKYGRVFSYCLPSLFSRSDGDLTFGPVSSNATISYTPIVTDIQAPSLYFLRLLSIRVGGQTLPISPVVFSTAGMLLDSGTVITRLPMTAYAALRSAFRAGMTQYKQSEPVSILDTCYELTEQGTVRIPSVVLAFDGGVRVNLGFSNIVVALDGAHLCLAFAGNKDDVGVGIIGNIQQAALRVVYDVARSRIGFGIGTCS